MPKRPSGEAFSQGRSDKRRRVAHETPTSEEIHTARQLQHLLTFDQDLKRARHGIQSLKVFLDGFGGEQGGDNDGARMAIIKDYLDFAQPRNGDEDDAVYLMDIMEIWNFGSQLHNDGITSAVPAVLALLLQVISSSLALLPHATGIARTLLQERQLKLISKNLSTSKSSGYIISPALRLLREVVALDGGALAKRVFRARDFTLASFARNLEVRNSAEGGLEDPSKPSVRTNAIKLFVTCLKFLPSDSKRELLAQKEVMSHLTFLLKDDPSYLILDMLDALSKHVLADEKIPRETKLKAFGTKTLDRLSGLYYYKHDGQADDGKPSVKEAVHKFLVQVCTTSSGGILYSGTGMYPRDLEDDDTKDIRDSDDFALERVGWMDKYTEEIPVANVILSDFIQKLRPWSSLKHCELLVAIFRAAPELVASYFLSNKSFSFEPKLSMTWIGYATFLFNTIQLEIPPSFGHRSRGRRVPPPTQILLDNILPPPLKQKDMVRSLSHNAHLISFFTVRILVIALQKLDQALRMHREDARSSSPIWTAAARRLIDEFCQRIPDMKEVTKCYKTIGDSDALQREATSRLLCLYYEVIPQAALTANFDVSPFLFKALRRLEDDSVESSERGLNMLELENLLAIAGYSPGMRWFSKAEGLAASPFVALLRVYVTSAQASSLSRLRSVLEFIATENQLILKETGLDLLLQVLRSAKATGRELDSMWSFLDNCVNRCASSPLKYLEQMEETVDMNPVVSSGAANPTAAVTDRSVSLILLTTAEQFPFVLKQTSPGDLAPVTKLLSSLFGYATRAQEDTGIINSLTEKVNELLSAAKSKLKIEPRFKGSLGGATTSAKVNGHTHADENSVLDPLPSQSRKQADSQSLEATLHVPFSAPTDEDNAALSRWASKSVDELVDGDYIPSLIRLLWSEHASIRQEAVTNILKMAMKIKESTYEEKDQLWLLLSELAESSRAQVATGPVSSPTVAFACHALEVLKNPLHCLYPKVNAYLTRSPIWSPDKVPLAHDILHGEPSEDDRYYTELSWLLSYLLDALRTKSDLSVFHHKKWFEKILALAGNPFLRTNLTTRILRIVYRATCIEGGSTTLVTRFGLTSWLVAVEAAQEGKKDGEGGEVGAAVRGLKRRVLESCDRERVGVWSRGDAVGMLDS